MTKTLDHTPSLKFYRDAMTQEKEDANKLIDKLGGSINANIELSLAIANGTHDKVTLLAFEITKRELRDWGSYQ